MKRKWRKYLLIPAVLTSGIIISTAKPSMALETSNLRLSAEVDVNNVIDGTPGFDANNDPGNDENAHNDIVRSNDIVTTPIKIVVNTADGSVQNNIKVKIQAIIENNKIGNTSKATFNDPSKTEMNEQTKTVTFTDTYTLTSTGQAISFPISSLANGVDNGTKYRIKYRVTILDEKGNPTNIVKEFEYNKDITISSRVNIGSLLNVPGDNNGVRSEGLIGEEFEGKNAANKSTTINAGVFAQPLPGRKDLKGAAAPTGDITYTFEKSATVAWDGGTRDPLDLTGKDHNAAITIGDAGGYYSDTTRYSDQRQSNIDVIDGKNGFYAKLGIQDWGYIDKPNFTRTSNEVYNPFSGPSLSDGKNITYANRTYNVMGSSGKWSTETLDNTTISGTISGYINNGYPAGSAYSWDRSKEADLVGKRNYISVGNFLMRDVNEYAWGRSQNPNNKDNTLTSTYKLTITSYKDAQGNTYPLNNSSTVNINYRNIGPGDIIVSGNWYDYTIGTAFTHRDNGDGHWINYGDGIAPNDSSRNARIVAALRTGSQFVIPDGARYVIKWNPQFANIDKDATANKNAKRNETIPSGYAISKNGKTTYGEQPGFLYQYGVLKDPSKKSDFSYIKDAAYDTEYVWYDDYNTAKQNGEVSAVMFAADMKMTATNAFAGPLMTIHDDNYCTNQQPDGSYNFATWDIYYYDGKFGEKASEHHIDKNYTFGNFAEWDPINQTIVKSQTPSREKVDFDSLAVSGAQYTMWYHPWSDANDRPSTSIANSIIKSDQPYWVGVQTRRSTISTDTVDDTQEEFFDVPESLTYMKALLYNAQANGDKYTEITPISTEKLDNGSTRVRFKLPPHQSTTNDVESNRAQIVYIKVKVNDKLIQYDSSGKASLVVNGTFTSDKDPMAKDWTNPANEQYRNGRVQYNSNTSTVYALKVARVGVNQSIDQLKTERDSQFQVITEPFTTQNADEKGVKGLIQLAQNNKFGSAYHGTYKVNVGYNAPGKTINFWYTDQELTDLDPNKIDKSQFKQTTANSGELVTAKYIYYEIVEPIRASDDVKIFTNVFTSGNEANDVYKFQSTLNSNTNYEVPVKSEISAHSVVDHTISGTLWIDSNKNGKLDNGEPRLKNQTVKLTDNTGESKTTTTNDNGEYTFTHVYGSRQVKVNDRFDSNALAEQNLIYTIEHVKPGDVNLTAKLQGDEAVSSKADMVENVATISNIDLIDYKEFNGIDNKQYQHIGYYKLTKNLAFSKTWNMNGEKDVQHPDVTLKIFQNGKEFKTIKLGDNNKWNLEELVPTYDEQGNPYDYSVKEINVLPGYQPNVNETNDQHFAVTNTWTKETTSVRINKTWVNFHNDTNKPVAKFHIYADGKEVKNVELTAGDNYKQSVVNDLPKYNTDGTEIDYTIKEYDVPLIGVKVDSTETKTNTFDVINTRYHWTKLPLTGTPAAMIILATAGILVITATGVVIIKRK